MQKTKALSGWRIGPWCYLPETGGLKSGREEVRLSTQLNQVLLLLIQNAPEVITRQQFMDSVWADKFVNEGALSRTIAELRKLLGDSASQAKYIKTIPKKGYQWVHVVEPIKARSYRRLKFMLLAMMVSVLVVIPVWISRQNSTLDTLKTAVAKASRVTAQPGMEKQSLLSADGHWLTYVKDTINSSQIFVESLADANLHAVIDLPGYRLSSPVFIAAQNLLLFTAQDKTDCYLKSHVLNSQVFKDLSPCYFNHESRTLSFDSKSNSVFFAAQNNQQQVVIQQLSLTNGKVTALTNPGSVNHLDWSPQISPDHQWLSYSRGNNSVRNIWLKNLQTGIEQPITDGEHYSVSHAWYDHEHIVFDSDLSGSRQLWLLNIHATEPQLLGAYGAQHPSFDHDKRIMAFQEVSYEANIWLFDVVSNEYKRVVHSTKYDNYPAFAADGQRFLFSSNRQDLSSIWLYDMAIAKEQLLISIPGVKLTRPTWHRDGRHVLITSNDDQGYSTLLLDLNTMQTEELLFGYGHLGTVEHAGSYFALAKSDQLQHKVLHMKQQQVDILPIDAVSRFMLLDDGRLVFTKTHKDGLFLYDLNTQQEQLLTPELKQAALNRWTAVNQSVYFDRGGKDAGVWRLAVGTGQLSFVSSHRPLSVGTSLSVNASETQLLITQTDRAESDILKTQIGE